MHRVAKPAKELQQAQICRTALWIILPENQAEKEFQYNMQYFKYMNIPLYIIALSGCIILGIFILPNLPPKSTSSFICVIFIIFFFIIFANQCLKAFAARDKDAELGAAIREEYERKKMEDQGIL